MKRRSYQMCIMAVYQMTNEHKIIVNKLHVGIITNKKLFKHCFKKFDFYQIRPEHSRKSTTKPPKRFPA